MNTEVVALIVTVIIIILIITYTKYLVTQPTPSPSPTTHSPPLISTTSTTQYLKYIVANGQTLYQGQSYNFTNTTSLHVTLYGQPNSQYAYTVSTNCAVGGHTGSTLYTITTNSNGVTSFVISMPYSTACSQLVYTIRIGYLNAGNNAITVINEKSTITKSTTASTTQYAVIDGFAISNGSGASLGNGGCFPQGNSFVCIAQTTMIPLIIHGLPNTKYTIKTTTFVECGKITTSFKEVLGTTVSEVITNAAGIATTKITYTNYDQYGMSIYLTGITGPHFYVGIAVSMINSANCLAM